MDSGDLTEFQQAAVMMHEMFLAYCNAGFSDDQALKLILGMMANAGKAGMMPPPSPNGRPTN